MESSSTNISLDSAIPEMIKVDGGTFQMGSNENAREQPIHQVRVPDFYLGKYPVINLQYAAFLNDYKSDEIKTGEDAGKKMIYEYSWGVEQKSGRWLPTKGFEYHPVIYITWYGAKEYCNWLSKKSGKDFRLPSESEWEYAARGGSQSFGFRFAGSNKLKEVGWYNLNSHQETKPVGLKLPNELGLYDMSGNVWEWCADHWHNFYEKAPKDGSAWIDQVDEDLRVIRGGARNNLIVNCRVSNRFFGFTDFRGLNVGFRVARY